MVPLPKQTARRASPPSTAARRARPARILPALAVCAMIVACTGLRIDYKQSWDVTVQSDVGTRLPKAQLALVHGKDIDERKTLDTEIADSTGRARIEFHEEYLDDIDTTDYFITASTNDTTPGGRRYMPAETAVLFGVNSLVVVMNPDTAALP